MTISAFSCIGDGATARRLPARPTKTTFVKQRGWQEAAKERLTELMQLPVGWDGYHAPAVSLDNATFAFSVLSSVMEDGIAEPSIVPTVDGSVQIEWHTSKGDIELRINRPNSVDAWFSRVDQEDDVEADLSLDFTIVSEWLDEIKENDLAAEPAAA